MESPDQGPTVCIAPEYADLAIAFSKKKATKLAPHRPGRDCAIDLQVNAALPKSRVYPLSQEETLAMETYITESLGQGYMRSSISPVSSSCFFVKIKEGGLRPCIDYRGLNAITVGFSYPLPLLLRQWNPFRERSSSQNWISGARIAWCVFGRETSGKPHLVPHQATMSTASCRMG